MARALRRRALPALAALLAAGACAGARAQLAGNFAFASDYRFRGVSLSNNQPAAQIDLGYDFTGGAYAGLFLSNVELYGVQSPQLEASAYAGSAWRLPGGWNLDLGIEDTTVVGYVEYDYVEWHAGATLETPAGSLGARLSYAPDYFGQSLRTWYAEVNGTSRLAERLRLVWHAGYLRLEGAPPGTLPSNADARAGAEFAASDVRLQFARVQSQGSAVAYPVAYADHGAWLVELRWSF